MILLPYLFIIVSVINISKCKFWLEPGTVDTNKIYLIGPDVVTKDNERVFTDSFILNNQLNSIFHDMCSDFYDIELVIVKPIHRTNKTHELVDKGLNVIDLFGPDHSYINGNTQNMAYAGAIFAEDKMQDVLTSNFAVNIDTQEEYRNDDRSPWTVTKSPLSGAKIMSKKATQINSGDLYDFVVKIEYTSSGIITRKTCLETSFLKITRPIVIVCLDKQQTWTQSYNNEKLNFKFVTNCKEGILKYKNHLTAILAPKAFEFDTELIIPTIFYDTPYVNSEYQSLFPNSMNLVSGMLFKYAFIKLIEDYGWERVAIISDDSPFSIELERELVKLFNEKRIVYNVQRCEERKCDFKRAVYNLRKMRAKIVIANVDEDNAKEINQLNEYSDKYKFNLVFRVPPFNVIRDHYFITLGPSDEHCFSNHNENNLRCTAIWKSIQLVHFANNDTAQYRQDSYSQNHYYSNFAEVMLRDTDTDAVATVSTKGKTLLTMYINADGVKSQRINTYVNAPKIPADNFDGCFLKSNDFVKYCNVDIILFAMLVIVMFAIMLLTISCYFHRTSPINAIKYQQF